jgi:hypothetical protein
MEQFGVESHGMDAVGASLRYLASHRRRPSPLDPKTRLIKTDTLVEGGEVYDPPSVFRFRPMGKVTLMRLERLRGATSTIAGASAGASR